MADVKAVNMHKRNAMGEKITGLKKGGAVKGNPMPAKSKSGKASSKKGC